MRGMLGRKQGIDGVKIDYALQLLGTVDYVHEHYEEEIPEDFKRVLEGYCAGVNAYAEKYPDKLWFKKVAAGFTTRPSCRIHAWYGIDGGY